MSEATPQLRRVLSLRDLIFYGIILITPIAPVPIYGIGQQLSHGHTILCLLLAGVAMMLTAVSYGRMANLYPSAGSAYVYVGNGLSRPLGFIAGWSMILDYLVLPIVAVVQASLAATRLVPAIAYDIWVTIFIVLITALNLRGIKMAARVNTVLLIAMFGVIGAFLVLAVRHLLGLHGAPGVLSSTPFYNPSTFNLAAMATATSFAALTYIGFDGLTTLAEDAKNPTRNIPLAVVSVCLFTTLFSGLLVYLAQLIWPDHTAFPNIETAFMDVTKRVGGEPLFQGLGIVIILSSFGAALAGQVAAARIPYAMGRDNILPRRVFAYLNAGSSNPVFNIVIVAVVAWGGSFLLSLEHAGVLLNFGAFLAFMGVNLAALRQCYFMKPKEERRLVVDGLVPLLGFLFCFGIWLSLPTIAKVVGGGWLAVGLMYYWLRTRSAIRRPAAEQRLASRSSGGATD